MQVSIPIFYNQALLFHACSVGVAYANHLIELKMKDRTCISTKINNWL